MLYFTWADECEDLVGIARELRRHFEPARLKDLLWIVKTWHPQLRETSLSGHIEKALRVAEVLEIALSEDLELAGALGLQLELSLVEALGETVEQIQTRTLQAIHQHPEITYDEEKALGNALNEAMAPTFTRLRATARALQMAIDRAGTTGHSQAALHAGQTWGN